MTNIVSNPNNYTLSALLLKLMLLSVGFLTTETLYMWLKTSFQFKQFSCYKYCFGISVFGGSFFIGFLETIGQAVLLKFRLSKSSLNLVPDIKTNSYISQRTIIVSGFAFSLGCILTPRAIKKIKN
jgi:hypothetical protein